MKILLIYPPLYDVSRYNKNPVSPTGVPLGIGSIAGTLERAGYNVKIIDMFFYNWQKVRDAIKQENADIIGITCMTEQRKSAFDLVKLIKSTTPQTKVVLGGHHATYMYHQILAHFPVDAVVLGEGEITFLELVKAYENTSDLRLVKGIAYKDNNSDVIRTEIRERIDNLDSLAPVAYHLLDFNLYHPPPRIRGYMKGKDVNSLTFSRIVASRGCIYRCAFCSTFNFWGREYIMRSPGNVVDELELLRNKYKIEYINFADDIFTVKKDWVINICKEIISRKLDLIWDCETRVDYADYKMFQWMREAGCYLIKYGIESGSPEILRALRKNFNLDDVYEAIDITRKAKIKSSIFLMVGNPGETQKTVNDSVALIRKTKPDNVTPYITMVFPGTPLYEMAKSEGYIDDDFWLTDKPAPYLCVLEKKYSLSQLRQWVDLLMCQNVKQPERFLRKLRNTIDIWFGIRLTREGIEYWRNDSMRLKIKWRL
ncbi:MAG: radical SAM protein [Candidatus Omnitrophota bacterium]|nr:radical SAM protein [Candidatus Omnitrophota bacterium]